ncbi:hypothetical protein NMG60_11032483 [Bertholletia excelsa]
MDMITSYTIVESTSRNLDEEAFEIDAFKQMHALKYLQLNFDLKHLKILDLSHSHDLTKTPYFTQMPNLERLLLEDCTGLVEVHKSIGYLEKLVLLNLRNCVKLRKLPTSIGSLKSLITLNISDCSNLEQFPDMRNMESLQVLRADATRRIKKDHSFILKLLQKPNKLKGLKIGWPCFPQSLVRLTLSHCNISDDDFPIDVGNLSLLKELDLSNNPFCSFPNCFKVLPRLEFIWLKFCTRLNSNIEIPGQSLRYLCVFDSPLLERVTFTSCPTRYYVPSFGKCNNLVEFMDTFKIEPIENVDWDVIKNLGLTGWKAMRITNVNLFSTWGITRLPSIPLQVRASLTFKHEIPNC